MSLSCKIICGLCIKFAVAPSMVNENSKTAVFIVFCVFWVHDFIFGTKRWKKQSSPHLFDKHIFNPIYFRCTHLSTGIFSRNIFFKHKSNKISFQQSMPLPRIDNISLRAETLKMCLFIICACRKTYCKKYSSLKCVCCKYIYGNVCHKYECQ